MGHPKRGFQAVFCSYHIKQFAEEYEFANVKSASTYVSIGKQGLKAFVAWLKTIGYVVEPYWLEPNKELFHDVGENWVEVSRTSPSYGFIIPDNDPKLVEFKLKNS